MKHDKENLDDYKVAKRITILQFMGLLALLGLVTAVVWQKFFAV